MTRNAEGLTEDANAHKSPPTSRRRVPAGHRPSAALVSAQSSETRPKAPTSSNLSTVPSSASLNEHSNLTLILPSPVANPTRTLKHSLTATKDASPRSKPELGCWLPVTVDSDEPASNSDSQVGSNADTATWNKIQDSRMVWAVVFLWILAVLQIVCGFWEFWKGARGKVHAQSVERLRWWDVKTRTF
jgi:hypothetical protein